MKRLYRSRRDRMIAGVAGGMAEYFSIDPVLVRLIWFLMLLPGGVPGLFLYMICWIIIPREPSEALAPPALGTAALPPPTPEPPVAAAPMAPRPAVDRPVDRPVDGPPPLRPPSPTTAPNEPRATNAGPDPTAPAARPADTVIVPPAPAPIDRPDDATRPLSLTDRPVDAGSDQPVDAPVASAEAGVPLADVVVVPPAPDATDAATPTTEAVIPSVDTVAGAAPTDAEVPPSRPDEPNRPEALRDDRA